MTTPTSYVDSRKVQAGKYVYFWYPHNVAYEDASISFYMKPPEEQNAITLARNQSVARTRGSKTLVYDRGTNFNTMLNLQFKFIQDGMRSQLITFLEAVQWASSIIAYKDMYGDLYYVRAIQEKGINYADQGLTQKANHTKASIIQWNFSLDLLDLTDNVEELNDPEPPVSSALALHLRDFDEPHDPKTTITLNIADGTKLIESFLTSEWRTIVWKVQATKAAREASYIIVGSHNRDGLTIATVTDSMAQNLTEIGTVSTHLTFTVTISGAGLAQVIKLNAATDEDGFTISVRRSKL